MSHPNRDPSPSAQPIQIPRTLERPVYSFDCADRATLDALAPDLADLPLPFIRVQLVLNAGQMLDGLHHLPIPTTISRIRLPSTLAVPTPHDPSNLLPVYPTHLLAVSSPSTDVTPDAPLTLIPIHGVVLAANCASSILPPTTPTDINRDNSSDVLVLPLCPVILPSVNAFLVLRDFMYTHRVDALLDALFPTPLRLTHGAVRAALGSDEDRLRLATHLVCAQPGIRDLLGYAARVRELWHTVCWLGMDHAGLWDTINLAWELAIVALNLRHAVAARAQERVGTTN
ncbi:hypothetical protein B0H11DRAFT_1970133 [Mycena galericulata]|nr:hypothetical protein B0H11DRAFT_1970133 [Mycena galericulata]